MRLERRDGEYRLTVLGHGETALVSPHPVRVSGVRAGQGPDVIMIGDPMSAHTTMELEVASVTINGEKQDFGDPAVHESSSVEPFGDDEIEVEVSESFLVSKSTGRHWFPTLKQISSQELFVSVWCSEDEINPGGARTAYCWTNDGGATWKPPNPQDDAGHSWVHLRDGASLWLSYHIVYQTEHVAACRVGRSTDGRNYTWSQGAVDLTPCKIAVSKHGAGSLVFARTILERPDGSLLATMYGRFLGDKCDRSILVRSTDRGATWTYFATMAYDPEVGGEGLNEPCVSELADGGLFCIMRNRSGKPMHMARSADGGKTWSPHERAPRYAVSVFPDLTLMSNGILACSFGRPGCHLMFSVDGKGEKWTSRTTIFEGPSTCYTAIREVAPGRLLYIHDVCPAGWQDLEKGQFNEVRGVFVTVARKQ